jgi:hypothetical protein
MQDDGSLNVIYIYGFIGFSRKQSELSMAVPQSATYPLQAIFVVSFASRFGG